MYAAAVDVRWELHPSEAAAVAREADLLVAAPPPWNAAGSWGGWSDVEVGGRRYGCFPHLGPGLASVPGTRCTDGYAAFRRLLDAAGDRPDLRRPVHDLLTGTSRRALDLLLATAVEAAEPYQGPALRRDRVTAEGFVEHGPEALRSLRRRHDLGPGYVTRERFVSAITAELHDLLGPDLVLRPPPDPALLGRRASRSLRHTTR
jgi:hypothetical protein